MVSGGPQNSDYDDWKSLFGTDKVILLVGIARRSDES